MQKRFKILNRWIGGENDPCFIIAEAGSNHNRDFGTAKKMIDEAKGAGADAIKFQTYSAETLYPETKKPLIGDKEKPFDIIKKIELPREWQKPLADYAKKQGLIFMSTPFDKEAIDQLNAIVPIFKWASPELIDRPLLEYAARKQKPIIISTGFYGLKEIENAVKWVKQSGNDKVVLLQCTAVYPTELEDVNLKAMVVLKNKFNLPVGFSDHTTNSIAPALAVNMGAKVIEKHFTLSRKSKGPDHFFALEPNEFKNMVQNIKDAEKMLGSKYKKPTKKELTKEKVLRRGVMATDAIKKGEALSVKNIITARTGTGAILPVDFYKILGKKAKRDIKKCQPIFKKDIK